MIFFSLLCAAELAAILSLDHGTFTYTLDDPYLHLAVAENIAAGHYGLVCGGASAPSSSFLWPFLLAPLSGFRFAHLVPLVIGYLASLGTIALFHRVLRLALAGTLSGPGRPPLWPLVMFLILATNLVGLVFTGMEHSLQVFLSVALAAGLIEQTATGRLPAWLPLALVLGPFVRYENLALSLPALGLLAWRRRPWVAAACLAALVLGLGGFSFYLHSIGVGWLPVSVTAKSGVVAGGVSPASILHNLRLNLRPGLPLLLGLAALAPRALRSGGREDRALAIWMAAGIVLHLLVGRFGWFARYEIYVWATTLMALLYLYRQDAARMVGRVPAPAVAAALTVFLVIACRGYLDAVVLTPLAANNIYEQQYQMRRFAVDILRDGVGANDLGLLSYRNEHCVVDLEGLASRETREARTGASGASWMDALCAKHHVKLAMVYSSVFPEIPPTWVRLGELRLGKRRITPADSVVTFWAVDPPAAAAASAKLLEFQAGLPGSARFALAGGSRR